MTCLKIERNPTELDILVHNFVTCLGYEYVIVAGYVAILLGRPRSTDDIDVIVNAPSGHAVYENVRRCGFEPLGIRNAIDVEFQTASIRFYKPPRYLPNFEVKPPRSPAQLYALRSKIAVCLGDYIYLISPIELQIAYKLWLGAEKDVEDAVFLYRYAAEKGILNLEELQTWARRLGANLSRLKESET